VYCCFVCYSCGGWLWPCVLQSVFICSSKLCCALKCHESHHSFGTNCDIFDTTRSFGSPFRYLIKVMLPKGVNVYLKTNCLLLYAFCDCFQLSLLVFRKFVACNTCIALTVLKTVSSVSLITCITTAVHSNLDFLWFSGRGTSPKHWTSYMCYQSIERQCTVWALVWAFCFTTVAETSNWRRYVCVLRLSVW